MHPLTLPCAQNVACLKISFACALVSKTQWISSMTLSTPSSKLELSPFLLALINISLCAPLSPVEGSLLAVQSRNWLTTSTQQGKERIVSGSSVLQERLSCSEST